MKTNPKLFFKYASNKLNYPRTIPDLKDGNKTISDNYETAKTFNIFVISVFTTETDTLPEFHAPSDNSYDSISFTVDKIKSKLKELNPYKSARVERQRRRSGALIVYFEHISHFVLVFLLSTLSM